MTTECYITITTATASPPCFKSGIKVRSDLTRTFSNTVWRGGTLKIDGRKMSSTTMMKLNRRSIRLLVGRFLSGVGRYEKRILGRIQASGAVWVGYLLIACYDLQRMGW